MPLSPPTPELLKQFAFWLTLNRSLPGAAVAREHFDNSTGQQRQGHFKQSFSASYRLLQEQPQLVKILSDAIDGLDSDAVFDLINHPSVDLWKQHLAKHSTAKGELYDYAILKGILPPSLGGIREAGGGGMGTLQRVLPLLARWIYEKQKPKK